MAVKMSLKMSFYNFYYLGLFFRQPLQNWGFPMGYQGLHIGQFVNFLVVRLTNDLKGAFGKIFSDSNFGTDSK